MLTDLGDVSPCLRPLRCHDSKLSVVEELHHTLQHHQHNRSAEDPTPVFQHVQAKQTKICSLFINVEMTERLY